MTFIKRWTGCYGDSWKGVITDASFAHPAKFSKRLVERILDYMRVQCWIDVGDVIGDPFAGVGCGGIVAAYKGYHWIGVELEQKFVLLAIDNFAKHRSRWDALGHPQPIIEMADSRQFDRQVAAILSSPPYVSGGHHTDVFHGGNREKRRGQGILEGYGRSEGQIATLKSGEVDAVVTSSPFTGARGGGGIIVEGHNDASRPSSKQIGARTFQGKDAERDPANGEVLPTGQVAAVMTSPPWQQNTEGGRKGSKFKGDAALKAKRGKGATDAAVLAQAKRDEEKTLGDSPGQIGQLKGGGLEAVITSPPYETISAGAGGLNNLPARGKQQSGRKKGPSQSADQTYGKTPGQIAHAKKAPVDAVISSPPYEDSLREQKDGIDWEKAKSKYKATSGVHQARGKSLHATYGKTAGQIGATKSETYWQAVAKIYHACLVSLKPGGVMAIVVKDFVKDSKRMPLCDDTMRLLVWLGFEEIERIYAMLSEVQVEADLFDGTRTKKIEKKSFFRRLHESKLPADDPRRIDFEEVLFVRKPL